MDSEPGGRWISYTELAEIRGTDKTSALKLALRKTRPRRKDNHGTMHVCVPPEWLGAWGNRRPPDDMPSSVPNGVDISRSISTLEMALAAADKRADQAEKRADRAEIRAEQAEARADQAQQAVEMERNRADRAEAGSFSPAEHGRSVLRFVRLCAGLIGRSMGLLDLGLRGVQPVMEHVGGLFSPICPGLGTTGQGAMGAARGSMARLMKGAVMLAAIARAILVAVAWTGAPGVP
jgi:hypothetical protein